MRPPAGCRVEIERGFCTGHVLLASPLAMQSRNLTSTTDSLSGRWLPHIHALETVSLRAMTRLPANAGDATSWGIHSPNARSKKMKNGLPPMQETCDGAEVCAKVLPSLRAVSDISSALIKMLLCVAICLILAATIVEPSGQKQSANHCHGS